MDFGGLSDPLSLPAFLPALFFLFFWCQADTFWEDAAVQEDEGISAREPAAVQMRPAGTVSCCRMQTRVQQRPCADAELRQEVYYAAINHAPCWAQMIWILVTF